MLPSVNPKDLSDNAKDKSKFTVSIGGLELEMIDVSGRGFRWRKGEPLFRDFGEKQKKEVPRRPQKYTTYQHKSS